VKLTFETAEPAHLDHVLKAVRQVPAVFDVYRVSQ
jgi:GTP pyrophosphokinase